MPSSSPYSIRVPADELAELKSLADAEGVELSTAMRQGARMFLELDATERAALDVTAAVKRAKAGLEDQVEAARDVLRSIS